MGFLLYKVYLKKGWLKTRLQLCFAFLILDFLLSKEPKLEPLEMISKKVPAYKSWVKLPTKERSVKKIQQEKVDIDRVANRGQSIQNWQTKIFEGGWGGGGRGGFVVNNICKFMNIAGKSIHPFVQPDAQQQMRSWRTCWSRAILLFSHK